MIVFILSLTTALGVRQQVLLQIHKLRVGLVADGARVWLEAVVDHLVLLQVRPLHERLVAAVTLERLYAAVEELMLHHVGLLGKGLVAHGTRERLEPIVDEMVPLQVGQLRKPLVADVAKVWSLTRMRLHMLPEATLRRKGLATDLARELVEMLHVPVHLHLLDRREALQWTKGTVKSVV